MQSTLGLCPQQPLLAGGIEQRLDLPSFKVFIAIELQAIGGVFAELFAAVSQEEAAGHGIRAENLAVVFPLRRWIRVLAKAWCGSLRDSHQRLGGRTVVPPEQTTEVMPHQEKASNSGLDQAVLVPLGMIGDEHPHGAIEILRELVFHTHVNGHRIRCLLQLTLSLRTPSSGHRARVLVKAAF
jgi:hypothetical protein